jgi:hypothetical protein
MMRKEAMPGWSGVDSTRLDMPGRIDPIPHPYGEDLPCAETGKPDKPINEAQAIVVKPAPMKPWEKTYV